MSKLKAATRFGFAILLLASVEGRAQTPSPTPTPTTSTSTTTTTSSTSTSTTSTPTAGSNLPTGFQPIFQSIGTALTNWSFISGYGHSLTANNNVFFTDLAFNFNTNVGVVLGYDHLWSSHASADNVVKGGVNLSARLGSPFQFFSPTLLTNVYTIPFVADLVATPHGNNAIGNIVTTGVDFEWRAWQSQPDCPKYFFDLGVQYENRSGQANWSANYVLFHVGISRRF